MSKNLRLLAGSSSLNGIPRAFHRPTFSLILRPLIPSDVESYGREDESKERYLDGRRRLDSLYSGTGSRKIISRMMKTPSFIITDKIQYLPEHPGYLPALVRYDDDIRVSLGGPVHIHQTYLPQVLDFLRHCGAAGYVVVDVRF